MPAIHIQVSASKTPHLTKEISDTVLDLTTRILKKKREVTAILIDFIEPDAWSIGGRFLSASNKQSFYLQITITDETNTKDEKAHYVKEIFAAFEKILGPLDEESYVYVQDVRAASYGYGGKTQEYRYQHPR